jgi:hypothetical protein
VQGNSKITLRDYYLCQPSTNLVVLEEAEHSQSLDLWVGVTCDVNRDRNDRGIEVQIANDGRAYP